MLSAIKKLRAISPKSKTCCGFTLVELLVALALGLTLSGAITKIYLQNNASARQDEQIARLQENGRFALKLLKREISMAGFTAGVPDQTDITSTDLNGDGGVSTFGCITESWAGDLSVPFDYINDAQSKSTWTFESGTTISCGSTAEIVDNTDIIAIKRTADTPTSEDGVLSAGASNLDNQVYLRLADSRSQKSWRYVAKGGSIDSSDLTAGSDIDYWGYYLKAFYIREENDIPILCAQVLKGLSLEEECYVDGIENIQIEVGLDFDEDATPDIFKADPTAAEIADTVAIRLYVLARSPDEISGYTNNKTYYLGATKIENPNDGYFRRVYSTTIQIKNARLPNA